MNGPLIIGAKPPAKPAAPAQRCENCFYAGACPGQDHNIICGAMPPTMFIVGMAQDALGRGVPQTLTMRPVIGKNEPRCSLWQPKGAAPGEATQ